MKIPLVTICCFVSFRPAADAEFPRYGVSKVADLYPGLDAPFEMAGRLTSDGAIFSGNAREGQLFAFTGLGGSPRLDIPAIPNAVGDGNTGNGLNFNEKRQIVQSVYDNVFETNSTSHEPFFYDSMTGWTSLGKPGGQNAIVTTVNEAGQVLAAGLNGDNDETSAWLYSQTIGWTNLGNLGHSSRFTRGATLNDTGAVAGRSLDANGNTVPFLWTKESGMQAITDGGSTILGEATALNNHGLVTGSANGRAFVFNGATMEFEFITEAASGWKASDINDAGAIIGASRIGGNIAGTPVDAAFYWNDSMTGAISLDALIGEQVANWFITDAVDINEQGWILATGFDRIQRNYHQVLLRPVPEPGAAVLLAAGGWFFLHRRTRRTTFCA
jgi:hypothetical protein